LPSFVHKKKAPKYSINDVYFNQIASNHGLLNSEFIVCGPLTKCTRDIKSGGGGLPLFNHAPFR
jgi:hypothetical protein